MVTYKMIYINARGRGEPVRLIFAYKSIEFEDERVAIPDRLAKAREGTIDSSSVCSNTSIIIFYNIILYRHSSLLYLLYVESPYGILPVLYIEGKVLSGNGNITRYLAEILVSL